MEKEQSGIKNLCGKNIRKYRELFDMTQQELADRMKEFNIPMSAKQISLIENLKYRVYDSHLKCLCSIFNISLDELVDGSLMGEDNIKVIWKI